MTTARGRGYEYFAVTDHAPNLFMQRMTLEKMLEQRDQLRRLSERLAGDGGTAMTLLHGTELNIAADGTVDWPEEILAGFDVCVASVHSHFDQRRCEQGVDRLTCGCPAPARPPQVPMRYPGSFRLVQSLALTSSACSRSSRSWRSCSSPWLPGWLPRRSCLRHRQLAAAGFGHNA